nr:hypothetical protein [Tanacetum cinerariifolium]
MTSFLTSMINTIGSGVFDLENVKTAQAKEIASLKKRVTKLEQKQSLRISSFHPFRADEDADTEMILKIRVMVKKEVAQQKQRQKKDQDQIERDAKVALKIQAHLDEEARTKRERQEEASKAALAEMYDEVEALIDADHELAVRLTHKEQEKYVVEERVYTLMLDDPLVSINMFVEKRYPLTKEILEKMLSSRLEAATKSALALDLIKFIKLQIEEK